MEIKKDYLKKFKMQIESYETGKESEGAAPEQQEIDKEFLDFVTGNSIYNNLINEYSRKMQQKVENINEEHKKQIGESERKNKRKIKIAKVLGKAGTIFLSKSLLELSLKKINEVESGRTLLQQKLDADWQELATYTQETDTMMKSILEEVIDETVIAERMHTVEEYKRRTNEELENALGEKILCEAVQDKHGVANIFQRLLGRFSKKDEMGER